MNKDIKLILKKIKEYSIPKRKAVNMLMLFNISKEEANELLK